MINSFPSERKIVLRERAAGSYFVSAYYMAKICSETLLQLTSPIIFSCVVYFLVGFQHDAQKFFTFMAFMMLCSLSATSVALFVSAICRCVIKCYRCSIAYFLLGQLHSQFPFCLFPSKFLVCLEAFSYLLPICRNTFHGSMLCRMPSIHMLVFP